jgi:hypothetical protein
MMACRGAPPLIPERYFRSNTPDTVSLLLWSDVTSRAGATGCEGTRDSESFMIKHYLSTTRLVKLEKAHKSNRAMLICPLVRLQSLHFCSKMANFDVGPNFSYLLIDWLSQKIWATGRDNWHWKRVTLMSIVGHVLKVSKYLKHMCIG